MDKHTLVPKIRKIYALLFLLVFLMTSCSIDDSRNECPDGFNLTFKYKYATQQRASTVDQLDLFVFDGQGVLCLHEVEYDTPIDGTFKKRLWLNPGEYTFVAWTGLSEEDTYDAKDIIVGKSRLEDVQIKLSKISNGKVDYKPGLLLHGMVTEYSVKLKWNEELSVPMVQDNNQINVIVHRKGEEPPVSRVGIEGLEINISDNNSTYFFNNEIDNSVADFQYTPFYKIRDINYVECDFFVLKLQEGKGRPNLTITNPVNGNVILQDNLINLIRKVNELYGKQIDLERDTFFKVELVVDHKDIVISLAINGWVLVNQGASVG